MQQMFEMLSHYNAQTGRPKLNETNQVGEYNLGFHIQYYYVPS